jgi:glycosyltransferase involved in cell wall biosynthesis
VEDPVKVLLVQPSIDPPRGDHLVAAWMLQALRDEHELSLCTWKDPDLAACNRYYGTSLRAGDFEIRLVPDPLRPLGRLIPTPLALLKNAYLMRRSVPLAARHDIVMTCSNEADFGRPGIQYVFYPKLDMARPAVDLRWYHASRRLLELYYHVCMRIARFSSARMKANLTLVTSAYIGARVRALHGIEPVVLYPPAPGEFPGVAWEERENSFVCIGRISPEKRIDAIIDILRRVRAAGGDVGLHVVGAPDDRQHTQLVQRLARENASWVRLHTNVPRAELLRLVARQRYGIHANPDEHFGIGVAEMVRAGCIVFVRDGGGPAEIVGAEADLCWASPEDALTKILAVLDDPSRQSALRRHLGSRAALFSSERFCKQFRALVRDFTARLGMPSGVGPSGAPSSQRRRPEPA